MKQKLRSRWVWCRGIFIWFPLSLKWDCKTHLNYGCLRQKFSPNIEISVWACYRNRIGKKGRTSYCAPSTAPCCDWCRALQRFSANSGISAIRSKLLINEEGTTLLTNYSRELGQHWKKQIETSPSLLLLVLWACWNQSPGTGGVGEPNWAGLGADSAQHKIQNHKTQRRAGINALPGGHFQRDLSASGILGHHFNLSLSASIWK